MKKKQKETQDILSYHTQAAGCSDIKTNGKSIAKEPIGPDLHGKTGRLIHKYVCLHKYVCPTCKKSLAGWYIDWSNGILCFPNYCSECGQKIDWSKIKDVND